MRRAIVATVIASAAVPQFDMDVLLPLGALGPLREQLECGHEVSVTDLLVAALGRVLFDHPLINGSFQGDHLLLHDRVDVAVLMELDDAMVGPVVRDAATRPVLELAADRRRLTAAAGTRTLRPADVLDATITLSNLGPSGVRRFRALVVPPQAAVLAVAGRTADGSAVTATLSCDHRIIDGAPAARFLADLAGAIGDVDRLATPRTAGVPT